ncbi:hypothetical protein [Streptomyces sp. 2A115]|uniref:hypothetical protein n=1 Tax=Streptomyces sp. 2A115 TaxID=3457439 RepID=UPI003FD492D7
MLVLEQRLGGDGRFAEPAAGGMEDRAGERGLRRAEQHPVKPRMRISGEAEFPAIPVDSSCVDNEPVSLGWCDIGRTTQALLPGVVLTS